MGGLCAMKIQQYVCSCFWLCIFLFLFLYTPEPLWKNNYFFIKWQTPYFDCYKIHFFVCCKEGVDSVNYLSTPPPTPTPLWESIRLFLYPMMFTSKICKYLSDPPYPTTHPHTPPPPTPQKYPYTTPPPFCPPPLSSVGPLIWPGGGLG